jgi:hypothetical protein
VKSADYSSKITYRILTHIIYIFGEIMEVTFAEEYSAIHKGLLHYFGLNIMEVLKDRTSIFLSLSNLMNRRIFRLG